MENTTIKSIVRINYNPDNPAEAYLTGNIGKVNV